MTQGYPMDKNSSPGGGKLGERLGRVETLLERLVEKEEGIAGPTQDAHQLSDTPESAVGFLTPYSSNGPNVQNAPVLSLFNNEVVCLNLSVHARQWVYNC